MMELWGKFWALEVEVWKMIVFFVISLIAVFCCGSWQTLRDEKKRKEMRERMEKLRQKDSELL